VSPSNPALAAAKAAAPGLFPPVSAAIELIVIIDSAGAIEAAGFEIQSCRRLDFRPALVEAIVEPKILGVARRP
jgi:hypothetical protein